MSLPNLRRLEAALVFVLGLLGCFHPVARAADFSFVPGNPPEMKPLRSHQTPAYKTARLFKRGANLGDYLETPPESHWGVHISAGDFAIIKQQGFDHVRVPIGWQYYTGPAPDFALRPEIFSRVDFVVTNALAAKLAVLINIHDFDDLDKDPDANAERFIAIWRQIAAHYRDFPNTLAFELDNEPHLKATTAVMNLLYARAISEIRQTNPRRTIFVEPGEWGNIPALKELVLPPDNNVIVSVHCYDPFYFTHQGASWAGPVVKLSGIQFPGPPAKPVVLDPAADLPDWLAKWVEDYNTLPADKNPSSPRAYEDKLRYARAWSDYYGRPVHVGEFGCYTKADPDSRVRFYSAFRHACDQNQLPWAIWDWNSGFHYWDRHQNQPVPGMREALFGK